MPLSMKRGEDLIISPLPSEKIIKDDIVVVVGKNESINGLEALE